MQRVIDDLFIDIGTGLRRIERDSHIRLLSGKRHDLLDRHHFHHDVGMGGGEVLQPLDEEKIGKTFGSAQAHNAAQEAAAFGNIRLQPFSLCLYPLDGIDQSPPHRRQLITARVPLEELGFKRKFQPVDMAGDGGVAGAQASGGG